jgi:N,N'-diacetyllegionaminate synthase
MTTRLRRLRSVDRRLEIGGRPVGDGAPTFVVAVVGSNHDGDLGRALALVDAAAKAGADAVRFLSYRAVHLLTRRRRAPGGWRPTEGFGDIERLELPASWHALLRNRAAERGIVFLSTPFDEGRAGLLAALGVPAFRVASGDLTHLPLLRCLGAFGRPVILSTELATNAEVTAALAAVSAGAEAPGRVPPVVLLGRGGSLVPRRGTLRSLQRLRSRFPLPIGWSDDHRGVACVLGAVAQGACLVEKLFTDDRTRGGEEHARAVAPDELAALVAAIRELERALAPGRAKSEPDAEARRRTTRRAIYAARALPAGTIIQASDLKVVRPAAGLPPEALGRLLGRQLCEAVEADEPIRLASLGERDARRRSGS